MAEHRPLKTTTEFAQQLEETVRNDQATPNTPPEKKKLGRRGANNGFYAKITSTPSSGGQHTIEKQEPASDGQSLVAADPSHTSDDAYSIDGRGYPTDAFVWAWLSRFDSNDNPIYLFYPLSPFAIVSANDDKAKPLKQKLTVASGSNLSITETNDGGDETLELDDSIDTSTETLSGVLVNPRIDSNNNLVFDTYDVEATSITATGTTSVSGEAC